MSGLELSMKNTGLQLYCVVNMFLKRAAPTCVNNNIHCQKTDVCGEKLLSEFNILKQFYSSGVRNVSKNTTGK